jgi:hypothetical protein
MFRRTFLYSLVVSLASFPALTANAAPASLTAAQVVEKNIAARGGLQAWRAVQTLSWSGKLDAGTGDSIERSRRYASQSQGKLSPTSNLGAASPAQQVQLPFVYEMKRGRKSRMEIEFGGKTAVQVYDGQNGWKYRPFLNRTDIEPFTADELKSEAEKADLDGYLVDYAAKGTKVDLEDVEKVEGHDAYKLKLTQKDGYVQHVWVDAQSFLDLKVSGTPRRMDGKMHNVVIYQRDFRNIQGLMIPFVLETAVDGYRDTHKVVIEKAEVNPKLADARFTKPQSK